MQDIQNFEYFVYSIFGIFTMCNFYSLSGITATYSVSVFLYYQFQER